jgi:selenocysteine-specific translation elongation factor
MLEKEEIIVLSKTDLLDADMVEDLKSQIEKKTGKKVFPISAPIGEGLAELQDELIKHIIQEEISVPKPDERVIIDLRDKKDDNDFVVTPE